jgi:hypothetical protein
MPTSDLRELKVILSRLGKADYGSDQEKDPEDRAPKGNFKIIWTLNKLPF